MVVFKNWWKNSDQSFNGRLHVTLTAQDLHIQCFYLHNHVGRVTQRPDVIVGLCNKGISAQPVRKCHKKPTSFWSSSPGSWPYCSSSQLTWMGKQMFTFRTVRTLCFHWWTLDRADVWHVSMSCGRAVFQCQHCNTGAFYWWHFECIASPCMACIITGHDNQWACLKSSGSKCITALSVTANIPAT